MMQTMKKTIILGLVLCLLGGILGGCGDSGTTIAEFDYDNTGAVAEVGLKDDGFGDKDTGYLATTGEGLLFASVNGTDPRKLEWSKDDYNGQGLQAVVTGGNLNPWAEGAYIEVQVSTVGYDSVRFSADIGGTNKGPKDFALQYSTDGITYVDTGDTYAITDNKVFETAFNAELPDEAAGKETLFIRMAVASDQTIGGEISLYGHTGGETAIGRIVVTGR